MAREAGPKKVFFVSAAPAIIFPNVYGIDIPTRAELVAYGCTVAEVAEKIGVDWLIYQVAEPGAHATTLALRARAALRPLTDPAPRRSLRRCGRGAGGALCCRAAVCRT